jgi:chromosome partitioning protein
VITIVISNQKGGTAKTTTAVTLGHRLALDGFRVLLVDTDVQGHIAKTLGLDKAPGIRRIVDRAQFRDTPLLIVEGRPALDVIPSDKTTEPAKRALAAMDFRERVLADTLDELTNDYDVTVIDCAPSVDVLHVSALVAADWLVVPSKLDYLAVDGVNEVLTSVVEIRQRSARAPELLGILPTFFDRQTNETVTQLQGLVQTFGRLVLPPIPVDTKLREAPAFGQTIWEYAPKTRSVVGVTNVSGNHYGGYLQFIDRVREVL